MGNPKMNLQIVSSELTMTSREIAELTGKEHRHVLRDIELMFLELKIDKEGYAQNWTHPQNGQEYREFKLPKDFSLTVVSGYSITMRKRIIDRWLELESAQAPRQLTASEMFLQNAQILVDLERKHNEQAQQLLKIQSEVKQVAETQLLTSRPQNAESITHLRPRAAKQFGLPERIVEYIIRQTPYAPKPAGMVRNDNEKADGATYAVYWTKDINDVMKRFVKECTKVSAAYATHPLIEGKFKFSGDTK